MQVSVSNGHGDGEGRADAGHAKPAHSYVCTAYSPHLQLHPHRRPQLRRTVRPPSAPLNLLLTTTGAGKIKVSWMRPTDGGSPPFERYYERFRVRGDSGWSKR